MKDNEGEEVQREVEEELARWTVIDQYDCDDVDDSGEDHPIVWLSEKTMKILKRERNCKP